MPTARKAETLTVLEDKVSRSTITISTGYRGMKVSEMTVLRRRMREAGVDVEVVKNTLLRIAAERAGKADLFQIVEGPTALIISYGDPAAAAKAVTEYVRTARNTLTIQGAYLEGEIFRGTAVNDLASLPSREQMIAQFAGGMQSPIRTFAGLISATARDFAGLIDARIKQMESAA